MNTRGDEIDQFLATLSPATRERLMHHLSEHPELAPKFYERVRTLVRAKEAGDTEALEKLVQEQREYMDQVITRIKDEL